MEVFHIRARGYKCFKSPNRSKPKGRLTQRLEGGTCSGMSQSHAVLFPRPPPKTKTPALRRYNKSSYLAICLSHQERKKDMRTMWVSPFEPLTVAVCFTWSHRSRWPNAVLAMARLVSPPRECMEVWKWGDNPPYRALPQDFARSKRKAFFSPWVSLASPPFS